MRYIVQGVFSYRSEQQQFRHVYPTMKEAQKDFDRVKKRKCKKVEVKKEH